MTKHKIGTREEWQAARDELLEREKELTRRNDELAQQRRELPWVRIEKEYSFATDGEPNPFRNSSTGARSCSFTTSCSVPPMKPAAPSARP